MKYISVPINTQNFKNIACIKSIKKPETIQKSFIGNYFLKFEQHDRNGEMYLLEIHLD